MRLNADIQEHFQRTRNVGALDDPTHLARATNPVCGDFMTLSLRIEAGRVEAARFQAEGCAPTYAAGSVLTERIVGQEVSWVETLEVATLLGWLGGVPPGKEHVGHLAIGTLRDALRSPVTSDDSA